jgi:PAS domain S-box-containing protein
MTAEQLAIQVDQSRATILSLQQELAAADSGLVALNLELDKRVEERTAELRRAHEELEQTNTELLQLTLELDKRVAERTAELRATNEVLSRQANLLDQVHDPIIVMSMKNEVTYWNKEAVRMYGWSAAEACGRNADLLLKTEFPKPAKEIAAHLMENSFWEGELERTTRDGRRLVVSSRWSLMRDEQGRAAVVETDNDITGRKLAEERIAELNRVLEQRVRDRTSELEAANKELEAFAYSVSHDLRAPLRAIEGFSQILLREHLADLSEKPRHYLDVISGSTRQMGCLIDDLLRFSRTSRQSLWLEEVDQAGLVRQCLDELQAEREGRNVNIELGALPKCRGDGALLKQVWVNLLSNALKFTRHRDAAQIEIGCRTENGSPVYFVRDNGAGFDMEYAQKLFGVFQRLHSADQYEGTGIGLALVQRIVHRHGGRVWAQAKVEQGATVFFTLGGSGCDDSVRQ